LRILSIQVGVPRTFQYGGQNVVTSIFKKQVPGPVRLRTLNLEGDTQSDLKVHGGRDKAVYAYSYDAYDWWKRTRPNDTFESGAMGENLSVDQMPEDQLFIGDTFEIGEAVVQITQPRFPCYKLGMKFNDPAILKQFMKLERPGIYFRVLKEGEIDVQQEFELIDQEAVRISVHELFTINRTAPADPSRIREILKLKSLNEQWREEFESLDAAPA